MVALGAKSALALLSVVVVQPIIKRFNENQKLNKQDHSAPARRAFGMAEGQADYDKFMPIFQGGGLGATRVLIDEPRSTLFLAYDHPASARFRQEFWGWVREARDYVSSRLG